MSYLIFSLLLFVGFVISDAKVRGFFDVFTTKMLFLLMFLFTF